MERCLQAGMRGAVIWQVPPPELSFASNHYEPFWAAAQDMDMPVNLTWLTEIVSCNSWRATKG